MSMVTENGVFTSEPTNDVRLISNGVGSLDKIQQQEQPGNSTQDDEPEKKRIAFLSALL